MIGKVVDVNTLNLVSVQRGLAFGLFHMEAQSAVQVFKGGEARISKVCWFNGSVIINIVKDWCSCQGSTQGGKNIAKAIVCPHTGC